MNINLSKLSDTALLDLRFNDLPYSIDDSILAPRIERLLEELEAKRLKFKPHFWVSTEWFSPDGVPGIAVPFYLMHPRLIKLERSQMYAAEGFREEECMKILRHEAGHAIDFAYRLHRRKQWREIFGNYSKKYPESYTPRPLSKRYVQHLDDWYAQAHPAEDFAETFAVWLTPGSNWKSTYKSWPALKKLTFVDTLMNDIKDAPQLVKNKEVVEPIHRKRMALRQHYKKRREFYGVDAPDFSDRHLRAIFSAEAAYKRNKTAHQLVKEIEPEIRPMLADWTGSSQYTIAQVFNRIKKRCQELNLRVQYSEQETRRHCIIMLTMLITQFIYKGNQRVSL
jgi:uncharacterized protein YukE